MMIERIRRTPSLCFGVLALVLALGVSAAKATPPGETIDQAASLYENNRLVEAKALLLEINRTGLNAQQRGRVAELMTAVDRRLRHADPVEISLEKAELALERGDLRRADRQANAARRDDNATAEQRREASNLLERSARMKRDLAPLAESALTQAMDDFDAGRYARAKAGFDSVYRSGVDLSTSELRTIERYRERIAELERERGEPFQIETVPLAVLRDDAAVQQNDQSGGSESEQSEQQDQAPEQDAQQEEEQQEEDGEQVGGEQPADQQADDMFKEALRFDAQRNLAEANRAYEEGRLGTALEKYKLVRDQYADQLTEQERQRAENRIAEIRAQLQQPGADLLEEEIERTRLVREQAIAEFENLLAEARQALEQGDTERARSLTSEARLRLSEAREVFSEQEFQQRISEQQSLLEQIAQREEQIRQREAEQREQRLAEEAAEQEQQREQERQRKINESLERIRTLQREQKYEEALQVVDQVLFLDPNNPAALLLKETLQDLMVYQGWSEVQREKARSYAQEANRIQEALVAPEAILDYPPDWPELSTRRGRPQAFQESPADRRVLSQLESERIPANFTDANLEDVVQFLAQVTNLNVDVDWDSLADIGVNRDDLVTLNLQSMPAKVILDRVLQKVSPDEFSRASWAVNDGILVIASEEALRKNTFVVIYDIRDLLFEVQDFDEPPDLGLGEIIEGTQGGTTEQFEQQEQQDQLTEQEMLERIVEIIQSNVDPEGWRANGGDTGQVSDLNNNLVVTNTARNHRQIAGLLSQLREVRAVQINVDTRFLLVNENFFERIGFDLDVVFNGENEQFDNALANQSNFALVEGEPQTLLPSDLVAPFFSPGGGRVGATPELVFTDPDELNQPGTFPEITVGGPDDSSGVGFVTSRPDDLSVIPAQGNTFGLSEELFTGSDFGNNILSANPALGVAGTFLDDIQVDFLLEATQADRRSVTLTAPRVTFTNGHAATISVLTEQAFISDLDLTVGTGGIGAEPEIGRVGSGFIMVVEGVVSADRRYVTLQVQAQVSEVQELTTFVGAVVQSAGVGDGAGGGEPIEGEVQLPVLQTTEIRTGVTVPDKGTLLLGGQRLADEVEVETGVPVLSKVPVVNRFFTNRIDDKRTQTLLILLKPTILIQSEQEEKNFPGLLDTLENRFGAGY